VFLNTMHWVVRALQMRRPELLIWLAIAGGIVLGAFQGLQSKIDDAMFWATARPASSDIVIVQIDPKSLAAIETWPWPRSRHAEAIDKLVAAGAAQVAVDIDFSSPSRPSEDERLAQAVANAGGRVVLPSFVQHEARGEGPALIETNPLPMLRDPGTRTCLRRTARRGAGASGSICRMDGIGRRLRGWSGSATGR
jgi:CHASE2 domain-containing sensor protein